MSRYGPEFYNGKKFLVLFREELSDGFFVIFLLLVGMVKAIGFAMQSRLESEEALVLGFFLGFFAEDTGDKGRFIASLFGDGIFE